MLKKWEKFSASDLTFKDAYITKSFVSYIADRTVADDVTLEEIKNLASVLEKDDVESMQQIMGVRYYSVIGNRIKQSIGKTSDPSGMIAEEPDVSFVEITEEEFLEDED